MRNSLARLSPVLFVAVLSGCAGSGVRDSKNGQEPARLFEWACGASAPGAKTREAKGSIWLKAKSPEASGQFPATVAVRGPDQLSMEVTNLVGGPEASIQVSGKKYEIRAPGKGKGGKDLVQTGSRSWAGIPLRWAGELFLGRVPCPSPQQRPGMVTRLGEKGELIVETLGGLEYEAERYVYGFRSWAGGAWPESLHWERLSKLSGDASVTFHFDQPEDSTHSPKRWDAKSSQGEVVVRWKDRTVH